MNAFTCSFALDHSQPAAMSMDLLTTQCGQFHFGEEFFNRLFARLHFSRLVTYAILGVDDWGVVERV